MPQNRYHALDFLTIWLADIQAVKCDVQSLPICIEHAIPHSLPISNNDNSAKYEMHNPWIWQNKSDMHYQSNKELDSTKKAFRIRFFSYCPLDDEPMYRYV